MQKERSFWPEWARLLQQSGLTEFAAALLVSAGPLNILVAQILYAGRPFLGQSLSTEHFNALVNLFEDQEEGRLFAAFIREERSR
jgi:hypothetical protein